ncbi:MAG: Lrp/AsnC family transcriptional regulator [Promethearchaeota archaeon]
MERFVIDSIDRQIIGLLKRDSRITRQKIAEELEISRQTVQNRIKALEDSGIILQYTCITNDKKLGMNVTAIVLVVLDKVKRVWNFTAQELWSRQNELGIIEVHHITGEYDVVLKMKTPNIEALEDNLLKISKIEGVSRTLTMVCLSSYDHGYHI